MATFAERARRELLATGETARRRTAPAARTAGTGAALTAQAAQVVRLARDGLSNPEIGARPFISPRTAQWHLSNVFAKLGISSRSQLGRVLPAGPDTAGATLASPPAWPGSSPRQANPGQLPCSLPEASVAPRHDDHRDAITRSRRSAGSDMPGTKDGKS